MEKKEDKNIEESYEKNYEIISSLNLDNKLKEQLINLNQSLYKIATTNINEPISIYIENIEQDVLNIIINKLIKILEDYEINARKPKFIKERYYNIEQYDLIIANDFEQCDELTSIENIKKEVANYKASLIMGNENKYKENFIKERDIKNRIVFNIKGSDFTNKEILKAIKEKLANNNIICKIEDDEWIDIIQTALSKNKCYQSNCAEYLFKKALNEKIAKNSNEIDKNCFEIAKNQKKESIKLEDLTGLEKVKKEIKNLKNYLAMQKRIGNILENNYLNMLFLGNPGTGKTTVGRIYANILYELGYIKENKLVEIIPTDLMANYVGQTKDQTRKILNRAKGGVLFIDEAYLISKITYSDGFASYMSEAVIELMKYMEDPKNVIIFAGYPIETRRIYDSNPGMKSRICKEIIFEDYKVDELYNILKTNLKKYGFKISKKAERALKLILNKESAKKNFGNARYCNVLMQQLLMNYANHNLEKDTYEIKEEDTILENESIFQIGFMEG